MLFLHSFAHYSLSFFSNILRLLFHISPPAWELYLSILLKNYVFILWHGCFA